MARLHVPKTSPIIEKLCKNAGVKLRSFRTPDEFEKEVIAFIEKHDTLFLATSKQDMPRCTPLGYRNIGTTIYILSEGGGKFSNLKANSHVSYAIASRIKGGKNLMWVQGLQCWGTAEVIFMKQQQEAFHEIMKLTGIEQGLKRRGIKSLPPFNYRFIKITPRKMKLLCLKEGINNVTWIR